MGVGCGVQGAGCRVPRPGETSQPSIPNPWLSLIPGSPPPTPSSKTSHIEEGAPEGERFSEPPGTLTWSVRPADKAPQKRYVVLLVALAAGAAGTLLDGRPLLGLVGFAIVLGSTAEFWLGARYSVGPGGGTARCGLSVSGIEWAQVRRVILSNEGVRLSPLDREGMLDQFRGVALRTLPENRERVVDAVKGYCGNDVRFLGE